MRLSKVAIAAFCWLGVLSCFAYGSTAITLTPTSLTFGSQPVGTVSPSQQITVTNTGTTVVKFKSITVSAQYELTQNCGSGIKVGASCTLTVSFAPTTTGTITGTVTVVDSVGSPQTASLTGTGTAGGPAVTLSPTSLTFATQLFHTTSPAQNVTLTNSGSGTLDLTSFTITGTNAGDFSQTHTCGATLAAKASCTISVTFTPLAKNGRTASLSIADNATGSPQTVALSGTGTIVQFSTSSVAFGNQSVGTTSSPQTVTVTNASPTNAIGSVVITLSGTNPGDFSQTSTCGSSIAAKGSCTITVKFTPTASGSRSAAISMTDNGGGSPQTVALNGTGTTATGGINQIQHIVFIMKENHSFNSLFGTFPGVTGATSGPVSDGSIITLNHLTDEVRDMGHDWNDQLTAINGGKMNQFDLVNLGNIDGDYKSMGQYYQTDIPNYWSYAQTFALSDQTFSSIHAETFPNRLYAIMADSAEVIYNPLGPGKTQPSTWGCDAPTGSTVVEQNPQGVQTSVFPCFNNTTMGDELTDANITWTSYAPIEGSNGYIYNTYDSINQIRNTDQWAEHVVDWHNFVTDATNGNLPAVSWLVSDATDSEHPPYSLCTGENWTVQQINAIMQGPDWPTTAIFLTYDEFGSFYDSDLPVNPDYYGDGVRVPMTIISPYAIPGFVDHTQYEFASVLKFIETRFGLAALTARDADASDMTASFNFNQTPLPPLVLNTRTCPDPGPIVYESQSQVEFGDVAVGTSSTINETMKNTGDQDLDISSITIGTPYTQTNTCPSVLVPGASCTFTITFTPTKDAIQNSQIMVFDNAWTSPNFYYLYGTGVSGADKIRPNSKHLHGLQKGDNADGEVD